MAVLASSPLFPASNLQVTYAVVIIIFLMTQATSKRTKANTPKMAEPGVLLASQKEATKPLQQPSTPQLCGVTEYKALLSHPNGFGYLQPNALLMEN